MNTEKVIKEIMEIVEDRISAPSLAEAVDIVEGVREECTERLVSLNEDLERA